MRAGEDIYHDDDGRLVSAGPDARVLVARKGREVSVGVAASLTAAGTIPQPEPDPQPEVEVEPKPKPKARKPRAADKNADKGENK